MRTLIALSACLVSLASATLPSTPWTWEDPYTVSQRSYDLAQPNEPAIAVDNDLILVGGVEMGTTTVFRSVILVSASVSLLAMRPDAVSGYFPVER